MGRTVKYTIGGLVPPAVEPPLTPIEVSGSTIINTGIDLEIAYGKSDFANGLFFSLPTMLNGNLFKCVFPRGTILWVRQQTPDDSDIFVWTDIGTEAY
mgnify:CR=1 FL=1